METLIRESKSKVLLNKAKEYVDQQNLTLRFKPLLRLVTLPLTLLIADYILVRSNSRRGLFPNAGISSLELLQTLYPNENQIQVALVRAYSILPDMPL